MSINSIATINWDLLLELNQYKNISRKKSNYFRFATAKTIIVKPATIAVVPEMVIQTAIAERPIFSPSYSENY